jgi:hypothetical protein
MRYNLLNLWQFSSVCPETLRASDFSSRGYWLIVRRQVLSSDPKLHFFAANDTLIRRLAYCQIKQTGADMLNERESPQIGPDVVITVDNKTFAVHRGNITVADLKNLAGVPAAYELEEIVDGVLKPLADDGHVVLKGGERFVSHPRAGASS